jgi:23S rRNA pseudouridine2604 synthase
MENSTLGSSIRLNKYIADSGLCSRREADGLLASGRVTIDGQLGVIGQRVQPGQTVMVDGQPIIALDEPVYLALHKPVGITCTSDRRRNDNIIDFVAFPKRIFTIGRLDRDSEGLILMTNDGAIVNKILRGQNSHEKEYRVTVDRPITQEFLNAMASGVPILDTVTRPCKVVQEQTRVFRIILTQGLNRQIRRMCEALGFGVVRLVRTRIMHINLGNLPYKQYRMLTNREITELRRLTADSTPDYLPAAIDEDDYDE